ncbi:MAG: glucosamine-6-phosphate deaminase [Flavobacteriaceae bacterium]
MQVELPYVVFKNSRLGSSYVANDIARAIVQHQRQGINFVLGLATGSTPLQVYHELIRLHNFEGLSFKNVISFNLDEYYPMSTASTHSYHKFMHDQLFSHIDIPKDQINIPDGSILENDINAYCHKYEQKITDAGGIDIQLLGIGRTGHIGFNEPGSKVDSHTRIVTLNKSTRIDAASDFFGIENVPKRAITMGVGTILKSKKIYLLAWGEGKSAIISRTLESPINKSIPSTYLKRHNDTTIILDHAAAQEITTFANPWISKDVSWDILLIKKATIWLSLRCKKEILKLRYDDYIENGLSTLLSYIGSADKINNLVYDDLKNTVTINPAEYIVKNSAKHVKFSPKTILVFSPHPDDDVISMGGTIKKMVEQGNHVHIAYQTSGNIAVHDDYVIQLVDLYDELNNSLTTSKSALSKSIINEIRRSRENEVITQKLLKIKELIRKTEARAASRYMGIKDENIHFLNLPFYESGLIKKKPISQNDVQITINLLNTLMPDQIYAAGDLSDPHGTHRTCLNVIFKAIVDNKEKKWMNQCDIWLYRGAWQEWPIEEIEMAVPLNKEEVINKRNAIFKHESQKDVPLFPGPDKREFWERAEKRNKNTALHYHKLGVSKYEAIEAFKGYSLQNIVDNINEEY